MQRKVLFATGDVVPNNGNGYYPADIRRLYNIPADLDGAGQTIGILEFSNGYSLRDAHQFWSLHGIARPRLTFVSVDGTRNDGGINPDDEEASLDLQWAGAVAPKAHLIVYEANAGRTYDEFAQALIRTLRYILRDTVHQPSVLSISYGDAETNFAPQSLTEISDLVEQLSARGVTVCIASGDQGAYGMHNLRGPLTPHADAPATVPAAVAVGGTSLQPDGTETAWTYNGPDNGGATGGGFSAVFGRTPYQAALHLVTRGIPDVALNADPATGYQIVFHGKPAVVGGTSVACPVLAAIIALANQRRAQRGRQPLAHVTELLYRSPASAGYRDVTVGNNTYNGVPGFSAGPGWDACTGWGSVDATAFINYLAAAEDVMDPSVGTATPSSVTAAHPVIHISAIIRTVEPDETTHGASHHHLLVTVENVLQARGVSANDIPAELFCAIRYGDSLGLPRPIPDLAPGQPMELQGEFVAVNRIYPSIGNPGDAVLHFTHHPVGFVIYHGVRYE
ncbi:S53 family peptidase [Alicyclobacillus contaminans]|uniref:S53 family peptidase n=1 Tax=Alicyclobacillus contaminans TaxID=392016 RepID=UPI000421F029|nr:S53 family peptidase [Alicyclobacillus contaminans]